MIKACVGKSEVKLILKYIKLKKQSKAHKDYIKTPKAKLTYKHWLTINEQNKNMKEVRSKLELYFIVSGYSNNQENTNALS